MVLRQADSTALGVVKIDPRQHGKAALKRFAMVLDKLPQMFFAWTPVWLKAKAVAHQNAVI
jgi:hypothetical protein